LSQKFGLGDLHQKKLSQGCHFQVEKLKIDISDVVCLCINAALLQALLVTENNGIWYFVS
jgi:hypothetical protein